MKKTLQRGIAQLVVLGIMGLLAVVIPVATKLVQQNQENRGQAAATCASEADLGKMRCVNGKRGTCKKGTSYYWSEVNCAYGCNAEASGCKPKPEAQTCSSKGGTCMSSSQCSQYGGKMITGTDCAQTCCDKNTPPTSTPRPTTSAPKTCSYGGVTYAIGKAICQGNQPAECLSTGGWKLFTSCTYGCSGSGVCNSAPTPECTTANYPDRCTNGILYGCTNGKKNQANCPSGACLNSTTCSSGSSTECTTANYPDRCANGIAYGCHDGKKIQANCPSGACLNSTTCSSGPTVKTNGVCGTSHNKTTSTKPTTGLCSTNYGGSEVAQSLSDKSKSYVWSCWGTNGGATVSCWTLAPATPTPKTCTYGGVTYAIGKAICQGSQPAECLSTGAWKLFSSCLHGCSGSGVCNSGGCTTVVSGTDEYGQPFNNTLYHDAKCNTTSEYCSRVTGECVAKKTVGEKCDNNQMCKSDRCILNVCKDPECKLNDYKCHDSANLYKCIYTGNGAYGLLGGNDFFPYKRCADDGLVCETRNGVPGCYPPTNTNNVCTPNSQYRCNGKILEQCNSTGTGWNAKKTCAANESCYADEKECRKDNCPTTSIVGKVLTPGQKACGTGTSNKTYLYTCNGGNDVAVTHCTGTCSNGACVAAPVSTCTTKGGVCITGVKNCTEVEGGTIISGTDCSGTTPVCCKVLPVLQGCAGLYNLKSCEDSGCVWVPSTEPNTVGKCVDRAPASSTCCGTNNNNSYSSLPTGSGKLCVVGSTVSDSTPALANNRWTWTCTDTANSYCVTSTCYSKYAVSTTSMNLTTRPDPLKIVVGDYGTVYATLYPTNSTDSVAWKSSNEAVATVAGSWASGIVTGKSVGTAVITATSGNISKTVTVTVVSSSVKSCCGSVSGGNAVANLTTSSPNLCQSKAKLDMFMFNSQLNSWTWTCEDTADSSCRTSNCSVSTSKINGVCGSANGKTFSSKPASNLCSAGTPTTVTLSGSVYSWSCTGINGGISVTNCAAKYSSGSNPPATCTLTTDPLVLNLNVGKTGIVLPVPSKTTSGEVISWTSSDKSVVNVHIPECSDKLSAKCEGSNYYLEGDVKRCTKCAGLNKASVKAIKKGTTTLTVTSSSCGTRTMQVTVNEEPITGIVVSPNPLNLEVGTSWALNVTTVPKGLSAVYEWVSDNANIATVNNNGLVTGKIIGETNIRVTVKGTNISYVVKVVVKSGPTPTEGPTGTPVVITGITLYPNPLNIEVGKSWKVKVTTIPSGLSATYDWKGVDANIATVDMSGVVTGKKVGKTTVVVTVAGTNISETLEVNVVSGPTPTDGGVTPTPTNEPTATPTNKPTATPTNEPTATPTDTLSPTPTDSDPQPVSDVKVSFMVSLGGIKPNAECISKYLIPQTKMSSDVINVTGLSDGMYQNEILSSFEVVEKKTDTLGNQVFKVTIDQKDEDNEGLDKNIFGSVDTYNWIKVKGPFHLKKRMCQDNQSSKLSETDVCDIDLKASNTSVYDFSEYTLSSGDIDKSGIINTADLSYVKSRLDAGADINCGVEGDLNMDGVVNSIDLGLVKQSLRERDDE